MKGVKEIFGHERFEISKGLPKVFKKDNDVISRIGSGEEISLSPTYVEKLGFHNKLVDMLVYSLSFQMFVSHVMGGASYLSNHEIDIDILSSISKNSEIDQRNKITSDHLKAIVPFVGDVPISRLLELRKRSEDEFITFRAALDKAIIEVSSQKEAFTVNNARELYADVIEPEVARLNKKVKEAKRDLLISPLPSLIASVGTISFGVYTGLMSADVAHIASAIGLSKVIYDTFTKAIELADVNKSIRQEQYYFLWKVKHLTESRTYS